MRPLCESTAASNKGSMKPGATVGPRRRQRRSSMQSAVSPVKETEEERVSIQEDIERAVFGRRGCQNSAASANKQSTQSEDKTTFYESSMCGVCGMGEPKCSLLPCMHAIACHSCSVVLRLTDCPVCQEPVDGLVKQ